MNITQESSGSARKALKIKQKSFRQGISLLEYLMGLTLSLIIVLASLEAFSFARNHFYNLKQSQETDLAAYSALDKIRQDLLEAGLGLNIPTSLGLIKGLFEEEGTLNIYKVEKSLAPLGNLVPGQTRISLESTEGLKKGREICLSDENKGEIQRISSVERESVVLNSGLHNFYAREKTEAVLLNKVSLYLEKENQLLRRKVNESPSQPLCEDVSLFAFEFDKSFSLIKVRLKLTDEENEYEISVFPKNLALVSRF